MSTVWLESGGLTPVQSKLPVTSEPLSLSILIVHSPATDFTSTFEPSAAVNVMSKWRSGNGVVGNSPGEMFSNASVTVVFAPTQLALTTPLRTRAGDVKLFSFRFSLRVDVPVMSRCALGGSEDHSYACI